MSLRAPAVLIGGTEEVDAPFSLGLLALSARRDDLVVLCADLSKYTDVLPFAEAHPDRFVQMGMAEQNMMGVAGGLAKTGWVPAAVTYGVFATRRAGEQIQMALATGPGRPAVVVAFLPGISTPFRATHQATDDLAIMRSVPRMTVIDPADATEMETVLASLVEHPGPAYLRGLRGRVPRLFDPAVYRFEIGRTWELASGGDVGLLATGLGTQWALEAADILSGRGIRASVLHVPTIKPADVEAIARFCDGHDTVLTIENHSVAGGLGSMVAEVLAERTRGARLRRIGVPDAWVPSAGDIDHSRRELRLDATSIADRVVEAMGTPA